MMFKLNLKILIQLIFVVVQFSIIRSDCVIKYPADTETVPKYEKFIGKFKLQIPYNGNQIKLLDGEAVNVICNTYLSTLHYMQKIPHYNSYEYSFEYTGKDVANKTSIKINCQNEKLFYENLWLKETVFQCRKLTWTIFSTNEPYSWCASNQNGRTFLLATQGIASNYTLAGICYNLEQLSLQTVTYNITNILKNDSEWPMDISETNLKSYQALGDDLWNFKSHKISNLDNNVLQQKLSELSKMNLWLNFANYELSSIVQGDSNRKYFKEFDNILEIVWWRNLRLGNWKRFMNTLENYAYNNSFQLYAGTSDMVRYPTDRHCEKNDILEIQIGVKNQTIPAYIWTYIKSLDSSNKDFIIVGYNSPYAEYFSIKNITLCPDICSEISWLREIYPLFHYTVAGVMFCCSPDFVFQSEILQGFPMDLLKTPLLENEFRFEETSTLETLTKY